MIAWLRRFLEPKPKPPPERPRVESALTVIQAQLDMLEAEAPVAPSKTEPPQHDGSVLSPGRFSYLLSLLYGSEQQAWRLIEQERDGRGCSTAEAIEWAIERLIEDRRR